MKPMMPLLASVYLFGMSLADLPSFDWQAALFVGAVVAVVAAVVIVAAIATPLVAIQAGATLIGTAIAIGTIAVVTGVLGGTAAGLYWGRQGDIEHGKQLEEIASQSNQLHITFTPSASDPEKAADFECNIIIYKEIDLNSRPPKVREETLHLTGESAAEFYQLVEQKLQQWFSGSVLADADSLPRRVSLYMTPTPGEGVYERLKSLVEAEATREVIVQRVDGPWKPTENETRDK